MISTCFGCLFVTLLWQGRGWYIVPFLPGETGVQVFHWPLLTREVEGDFLLLCVGTGVPAPHLVPIDSPVEVALSLVGDGESAFSALSLL